MMPTYPKESIALKVPPYVAMYPALANAARRCGYALAVHGSMARDMDLIAVPWVEGAVSAEALVEELRAACGGWIHAPETKRDPTNKPHGRMTWTIHMGGALDSAEPAAYIDLSVMPLRVTRPQCEHCGRRHFNPLNCTKAPCEKCGGPHMLKSTRDRCDGRRRNVWTQEMRDDVMKRHRNGESHPSIGKDYHVGRSRIRTIVMQNETPAENQARWAKLRGACVCPMECDCQNPEGESAGVSNHCPEHNETPAPYPGCHAGTHRNGAEG